MSDKKPPPENISKALELDGSPQAIREYYAEWSRTYDQDLTGDHFAPQHMVSAMADWLDEYRPDVEIGKYQVMDVGCGTGLVGKELVARGFREIDGIDLSPDMIEQCRQLGIYRELVADVDINLSVHTRWNGQYDIVTCCGVFTLGHVQPESLINMLRFAKPGGLVITTTRDAYYESTHYQQVSDQVVGEGWVKLRQHIENAPYTNDSNAHYWLYELTE